MKKIFKHLLLIVIFSFYANAQHIARFVLIPDSQDYFKHNPEVMEKEFDWIAEQKNVDFVIHLGDVTDNNREDEWAFAQKNFQKIKIPYSIALGNHDLGTGKAPADTSDSQLANKYFPSLEMDSEFCYEKGKMDNRYYIINAGKKNWLILSLAFAPSDKVIEWANGIIQANSDKKVIISTHAYMYSDNTRIGEGDSWRPQSYGLYKILNLSVNDGEQIWEKLVSKHKNVVAVFSGHILYSGVGLLISKGEQGNNVVQTLSNYQGAVKNSIRVGNGYVRIVEFDTKNDIMNVSTYSTWENRNHPDEGQNFTVDLNKGVVR